ncbi:MAG: DUF4936 family protein [Burkholderiaceae bacterium]
MSLAAATKPDRTLYVYYKVEIDQCASCAAKVRDFQQQLVQTWPGLRAELMQRPEVAAGRETWMEVYHHPLGLSDETLDSIGQLARARGLPMPRASELFIPLGHTT